MHPVRTKTLRAAVSSGRSNPCRPHRSTPWNSLGVSTNPRRSIAARYPHRIASTAGHQPPFTNRRSGTKKVPVDARADDRGIAIGERACVPHRRAHARYAEPAGRSLHHNGDFNASSGRCPFATAVRVAPALEPSCLVAVRTRSAAGHPSRKLSAYPRWRHHADTCFVPTRFHPA